MRKSIAGILSLFLISFLWLPSSLGESDPNRRSSQLERVLPKATDPATRTELAKAIEALHISDPAFQVLADILLDSSKENPKVGLKKVIEFVTKAPAEDRLTKYAKKALEAGDKDKFEGAVIAFSEKEIAAAVLSKVTQDEIARLSPAESDRLAQRVLNYQASTRSAERYDEFRTFLEKNMRNVQVRTITEGLGILIEQSESKTSDRAFAVSASGESLAQMKQELLEFFMLEFVYDSVLSRKTAYDRESYGRSIEKAKSLLDGSAGKGEPELALNLLRGAVSKISAEPTPYLKAQMATRIFTVKKPAP